MTVILPKLTRLRKPASPDSIGTADSPFGPIFVAWQDEHIVRLTLAGAVDVTRYEHLPRDDARASDITATLFPASRWRGHFAARLSLGVHGTDFQWDVIQILNEIPAGKVATYAGLAALAGKIGAARAAGSVCARNGLLFVLPCHRVVQANGVLGGYLHGDTLKRRLLSDEGMRFADTGRVLS